MAPRHRASCQGKSSVLLLVLLVAMVAILAYALGRSGRAIGTQPEASGEFRQHGLPEGPPADSPGPDPAASENAPEAPDSIPTYDFGIRPARTRPPLFALPAATPPETAPSDTPLLSQERPEDRSRCLTLEGSPNYVEAYGPTGPVVQLTVRVRNSCSRAFSGREASFRASALSPSGDSLATEYGRFSETIGPFGTAETLIALPCDPTRVARYQVELQ